MRVRRILGASLTSAALALSMLASAVPAAAVAGNHAAYFSESSFLSLAPGQSGQFAVGYGNTGDTAWVKGDLASQASLHTRGDGTLFAAGWGVNWTAPNVYTNQTNDLVAPGQVGFFVYNVQVPLSAPQGPQFFYGLEWVANAPAEDYGYYQVVTVTASTLAITASSPTSPSTTTTPTISGTGATPASTITVQEGTTSLCTGVATTTGTFSCITSALSAGTHSLTATATGQGTSSVFTYVVDNAAPAISSVDTAQGLLRMNVCFNKPMSTSGAGSITTVGSYTLSGFTLGTTTGTGQPVSSIVASGDSRCALFVLNNALTNNSSYTLTVNSVKDLSGNTIAAGSTYSFTATDAGNPTVTGITQPGNQEIVVTFSEPMTTGTLITSNFKWDSASFPGTLAIRGSTAGQNRQVRLTFGSTVASVGSHALDISAVTDTAGNFLTPNPTSFTVTIATDTTRPTTSSAIASRADYNLTSGGGGAAYLQTVNVSFNEGMKAAAGGWSAGTSTIDTSSNYTLSNPDGSAATTGCSSGSGTALSVVSSPPVTFMGDDVDARWELRGARLTFNALFASSCQYTLSISNVQDQAGNAISPNPTLVTTSDVLDSASLTIASATTSASVLTVCHNKSMFASTTASTGGYQSNTTASNTANYVFTGSGVTISLTWSGIANMSTDGRCIAFTTGSTLVSGTYTLTVTGVTDPAGNVISPNPTTYQVGFSDTGAPTLTAASYISSGSNSVIRVVYSKAMTGGASPTNSAGNVINYSLNNQSYGTICSSGSASISATSTTTFELQCSTNAFSGLGNTGTNIISARNVADSNGNVISPNPMSRTF